MQILLLIAGLVLLFAGPWFAGQVTVAIILLALFGAACLIQLVALAFAARVARKASRRPDAFGRVPDRFSR